MDQKSSFGESETRGLELMLDLCYKASSRQPVTPEILFPKKKSSGKFSKEHSPRNIVIF